MLKRLKIDKNGTHSRVDGGNGDDDADDEVMRFTTMFIDNANMMMMMTMATMTSQMPKNADDDEPPTLRGNIQPICVVGLDTLLMTTIALVDSFGGSCM